jgi:hypothetical protein
MKDGKQQRIEKKEAFREYIANHPYTKRDHMTPKELKTIPKADRPDLAQEQNFLMTVDPALGYVPSERLKEAYKRAEETRNVRGAVANVTWNERGPNNIGGRTRALMFDPNDAANGYKKVWAGGVSGGLWYNSDITDASSEWTKVSDTWDNLAITTIAYDPSNTQIFYVGTGEGFYNADAVRGGGIWKTEDGGTTWSHLSTTDPGAYDSGSDFDYVQKIVVTSGGDVFAATRGYYTNRGGIMKSTDGGANWAVSKAVSSLGAADRGADIEISANGDLYASLGLFSTGYMFKSTDNGSSWTDITPASCQRIEIACAPSNNNVVYAVASNGNDIQWFKKSIDGGSNWSNLSIPAYKEQNCVFGASDFARGQAWYDLIMGVHPTDADLVVLGGIDMYRSTDGGANFGLVSYWTGWCDDYVHADQHAIVFHPTNHDIVVTGSDGGVSYSADLGDSGTADPEFDDRNAGYNVTQFYSCAIHPTAATDYYLGGTQDNGTFKLTSAGVGAGTEVSGGDGAFCFIDQTDPTYQLSSYVYNNWYRSSNSGSSFSGLSGSANTGRFINPADYDNDADILYAAAGANQLYRISGVSGSPSATTKTVGGAGLGGDQASAIIASPYNDHVLFVATGTGLIYKVSSANGSPTSVDIDAGTNLPGGYISSIDIGADENNLMVTYTTYGVNHVYITTDGGTNWSNKNGDLPDMPVRWGMYNPLNRSEVFLATEVGVWSTTDITAASPEWGATNGGLANVRTDMLQYRSADRTWLAATHGRGLFTYPEATVEITFQVDMQNQTVSGDGVHIAGSFGADGYANWDPAGIEMTDGNSDDVYTVTLTLTANTDYEFKYINGNAWGSEEIVPGECIVPSTTNRGYTTTTNDATLDEVCFSSCSDCSAAATHYIAGDMNTWSPNDASYAMTMNANGLYELTSNEAAGTYEYKLVANGSWYPGNNQSVTIASQSDITWLANSANMVTHRVPTIVGDFFSASGLGNDWDLTNPNGDMTDEGDGTYTWQGLIVPGDREFKVVLNQSYDQSNPASGNTTVTSTALNQVKITYDFVNNTISTTEIIPTTATWTGTDGNDWATAGNWDVNGVPGSPTNVTIPATGITNFPTVNEARACNNVSLAEGATILGFANLTVNGTATITQNLTGGTSGGKDDADAIYHYISSPMASATAGSVFPLTAYVRAYDETTQTWVNKTQTDVLTPGTGYSLWLEAGNAAISYEGQFNTADIPVSGLTVSGAVVDYSGYHFLGNPYPAALNWDAGTWSRSNLDGSVYIYDGTAGNYKSWNGTAGSLGDGIIGVGQGFFVKANTAGASLTIPVDAALHNSKAVYKNEVENLLNIAVRNTQNNTNDETVIHFRSDANEDFDNQMDAYKITGSVIAPQLYTFAGESHISINTRPFTEDMKLNFETGRSGSFVLEIPAFSMNYDVTLEDKLTGETIRLSDQTSYSFTASDNDVAERFILRFKDATSVEDVFAGQMQVYSRDKDIIVDNATGAGAEAMLFTVHGQKLGTFTIENGINKIKAPKAAAVYLIQINSGSKTSTQKVFIK